MLSLSDRILADHRQPEVWIAKREGRIGASDAAKFAKEESWPLYVAAKLAPPWQGSAYADWGNDREPVILEDHGYEQNHYMFTSLDNPRYVATPDGIRGTRLAQVKTTTKAFKTIPANYRRQVWWEQFVMGPEYTESDFIWELHEEINGVFTPMLDSVIVTIERDEAEIAKMERIARKVLIGLDAANF